MKMYRILKKRNWRLAASNSMEGWAMPNPSIRKQCQEVVNIEGVFALLESEDYLGYEASFELSKNGWTIANLPAPAHWGRYECPKDYWLETAKENVDKYMLAVKSAKETENKDVFVHRRYWRWPWHILDASNLPYVELPTEFDRNSKRYIRSAVAERKFIFVDYKHRPHFVERGTKITW